MSLLTFAGSFFAAPEDTTTGDIAKSLNVYWVPRAIRQRSLEILDRWGWAGGFDVLCLTACFSPSFFSALFATVRPCW